MLETVNVKRKLIFFISISITMSTSLKKPHIHWKSKCGCSMISFPNQQKRMKEKIYTNPLQKVVQDQMWRLNCSLVFQKQEHGAFLQRFSWDWRIETMSSTNYGNENENKGKGYNFSLWQVVLIYLYNRLRTIHFHCVVTFMPTF